MSATHEVNSWSLGYASADVKDGNTTTRYGVHEGQSAVGASYAFGDLEVSLGKQNRIVVFSVDALVSATKTMTVDALTIVDQAVDSPLGDYQLNMTYAFNNAISISSEVDKGKTTNLVGTCTEGAMIFTVARQDDTLSKRLSLQTMVTLT